MLNGADLRNANLSGASLFHAHLTDDLNRTPIQANLSGAVLAGADLHRADLGGATLNDAMLHDAMLNDADMSGANLSRANLSRTKLSGAILDHSDLSDASSVRQAQLDQACGTDTKLPAALTLKPCPPRPTVAPPLNRDGTP